MIAFHGLSGLAGWQVVVLCLVVANAGLLGGIRIGRWLEADAWDEQARRAERTLRNFPPQGGR